MKKPTDTTPLTSFTAIDFETAHGKAYSICQIGLVRVENGLITDEINILVQPPANEYHWGNTRVHGITSRHTANAPTFDAVWHKMEPYITGQHVVAHNAPFDCSCLLQTLAFYNLPQPEFQQHCTVKIFKRNLALLCKLYDIELKHHDALSDARACATLFMMHLDGKSEEMLALLELHHPRKPKYQQPQ
jgi:DNA polymerase-3 subunit epsilon